MPAFLLLIVLFPLHGQRPDPGPNPRPNPAREASLQEILPVTSGQREDDHPAIASHNGVVWTAWVSYAEATHDCLIFARSYQGGKWGTVHQVTPAAGDYYKPAIATDSTGAVWVAWPAQVAGNWDLYGRRLAPGGTWGPVERWTTDPAPDILPAMAASGSRVMLVWQTARRRNMDIFHRLWQNGAWSAESPVTADPANDWEPALAAAPDGSFHAAWDSNRGDYDVRMRSWRNGRWGAEVAVAQSARLENHASIAADAQGRVWIAFEVGPEGWASDSAEGGLRPRRDIGLACLKDGRLYRVATLPEADKQGLQAPLAAVTGDGRLHLFLRRPMNRNWLSAGSTSWNGSGWTTPEWLPYSEGRIDQRIVAADAGQGKVVAVYPSGSGHNYISSRTYSPAGAVETLPPMTPVDPGDQKAAPSPAPHHTLQGYTLVWGDLHRHTDISEDGGIIDGSLLDAMRYSLDAAGLDFIGITDHTRYLPRRYNLFRMQQVTDALYKTGWFAPLHAYERSQYTPWGHRNVVHLNRNYTPVPASYDIGDQGVSPWGLFDALRGKKALSIPHTSAWGNKQVSWDYYDPQVERLVEIYQGLRSTYEYNGAPDPAGRAIYEKDSKYFVWDALARGRKMGFIASSDHRSTHMSFAAVYARGIDRASIFEGLTARRTYAATDKILLDFSIGNALMGQEVTVTGVPEIRVAVEGTAPLARVDIVRNGTFVYTAEPNALKTTFTFRDQQFDGRESYYYVRVIQADKNMAWASPVWVKR